MGKIDRKSLKFVAVSGYGWSGSGAVVDLLKEFKGYWECGEEFRLLRDPYGIFDLEHALIEEWDLLNADAAIRDFLWLTQRLYRRTRRLGGTGCGYIDIFGPAFMEETKKYVRQLSKFEFRGHWWWFEFKQSDLQMILNRVKKRLHISEFEDESTIAFVDLEENDFCEITKSYLNDLFVKTTEEKGVNAYSIILDQAFSDSKFQKASRYFEDLKLIVVDRDPRDNYMDLLRGEYLIGKEIAKSHNVEKFIQYYKRLRKESVQNDSRRILYIKFEELILDYENTVEKILNFLGEDKEIHVNRFVHLNPNESRKNIGMWKDYQYQNEIKQIERELM